MPARPRIALTVENIIDGLRPLIVPIDWIETLPGNPRRGRVEAVAKSYTRFGQRKPIVVNTTGEVDGHPVGYTEAGNHQLLAARSMDWKYIAVVWVTEDELTAKAFSLADNQLHDIGEYDTPALAEFVADIAAQPDGVDMLADAGFNGAQLTRLIQSVQAPTGGAGGDGVPGVGLGTPVISTSIVFDDEAQQSAWYRFVRHLRDSYPDAETTGERIALYVDEQIPEGE